MLLINLSTRFHLWRGIFAVMWMNLFLSCFSNSLGAATLDTLPVVVHVIHTGTPVGSSDNPSDTLINDLITQINNAFQKDGPLYGGADIGLAFTLATKSPDCASTTGIVRIDGSNVDHYETGGITSDTILFPNSAHEIYVKSLSRWPNTDYINLWVVNMIDGDPNGIAGYAYFPQYNSALTDGIVVRADAVNDSNKVIIHELGHYFNLAHTFGNAWSACITENNCATDGDQICDTENCRFTFDCSEVINPCTGNPYSIADPGFNYTVLNNYMGYADCQWMFTEEQKDEILSAISNFRPGLLTSSAWHMPGEVPLPACEPTAVNGLSPYYGIERVKFGNLNLYSNSSEADGTYYVDHSCNQQIVVHTGESIPIEITGSYENYQQIKIFLDLDNDGEFDLPDELILSGNTGVLTGSLSLTPEQVQMCIPIRLRVVADHPGAPSPTACMLTGTVMEGVGQIEDYTVIVKPRQLTSIGSGNWDNPSIWSCNCIPTASDHVVIRDNDLVTVPLALGTVQCAAMTVEQGGELRNFGIVRVVSICD